MNMHLTAGTVTGLSGSMRNTIVIHKRRRIKSLDWLIEP